MKTFLVGKDSPQMKPSTTRIQNNQTTMQILNIKWKAKKKKILATWKLDTLNEMREKR